MGHGQSAFLVSQKLRMYRAAKKWAQYPGSDSDYQKCWLYGAGTEINL